MSFVVTLLAEGVDRNILDRPACARKYESPSSRRAWIEILVAREVKRAALVALLAEGVDRNHEDNMLFVVDEGRPPRGGCG